MGKILSKIKYIFLFVIIVLIAFFSGQFLFNIFYPFPQKVNYGVSFSEKFASELNTDWKAVYLNILDDLKVKYLRLPTYWDTIEIEASKYDFSIPDFMLDEAQKRGVYVILVLGERQYRWPECHIPSWARNLTLDQRRQKILDFVAKVVERYRRFENIRYWQVENETFLESFGEGCDKGDIEFLKYEVELVKEMDRRPIVLTDSGELSFWVKPMQLSDVFGTTVYRTVYNKLFGFQSYPILPYFYNIKSKFIRSFFAPDNKKTIIVELQGEPWSPINDLVGTPINEQLSIFSVDKLKDNVEYGKDSGFDEIYLWGVEWWYWMAQRGQTQYWEYAKSLFR